MDGALFGSELWTPALDKYAEATGLSVELFGIDGERVLGSTYPTPLAALFREYGFDPGLVAQCARRCLSQTFARPIVLADEQHGLIVAGTALVLESEIVGAAVAGYALAGFSQVGAVQRWATSVRMPFERLWGVVRALSPVPERRLMLHGELLKVLGDALLRENHRTRQYEDTAVKLQAALAAKDEFLAVLSHELRTPLAPIAGWASVIKNARNLAQARRAAEAIERNALLQGRMIDDLLDMSLVARGAIELDLEILELQAVIRTALEPFAEPIGKKALQLALEMPGEPVATEGDAVRLQQVFRNVLSNAVKFTPTGGKLRIALSCEANHALVRIADTGKGIAPEFLPFAFDIFRQQQQGTRRASEGLGIGLSIVKRLAELHNGSVSIASPGAEGGTEVTVRLPLAVEAPGALDAPLAPATSAALALAGLSVLVVEDSEDARESLRAQLELLGARVLIARDGREGLAMLLQGTAPDVVLCDLLMPRMDGYELMRELDGRLVAHPPVIAVSGLASAASRERTLQAGFAGHIKKPFSQVTVVAAIGAALAPRNAPA